MSLPRSLPVESTPNGPIAASRQTMEAIDTVIDALATARSYADAIATVSLMVQMATAETVAMLLRDQQ